MLPKKFRFISSAALVALGLTVAIIGFARHGQIKASASEKPAVAAQNPAPAAAAQPQELPPGTISVTAKAVTTAQFLARGHLTESSYMTVAEYVDAIEASAQAKQRTKMILKTVFAGSRVGEACTALDICPQRFQQLREEVLQAALASMEVQPGGRRRRPLESEEMAALRAELEELKLALHLAQVRAEIALAMPKAVASAPADGPGPEKKTAQRPKQQARLRSAQK